MSLDSVEFPTGQGQPCCLIPLHPALEGEGEEVSAVGPRCHQKEHEQLQRLVLRGYPKGPAAADPSLLDVKVPAQGTRLT